MRNVASAAVRWIALILLALIVRSTIITKEFIDKGYSQGVVPMPGQAAITIWTKPAPVVAFPFQMGDK